MRITISDNSLNYEALGGEKKIKRKYSAYARDKDGHTRTPQKCIVFFLFPDLYLYLWN